MNPEQLIAWLKSNGITVAEKVPQQGGTVLIFAGRRPFPWDGRPQWYALPLKDGQASVAKQEIEALLRHFCEGQIVVPKGMVKAAAAQAIGVQPLHPPSETEN